MAGVLNTTMATLKQAKIGVYGPKTRSLQKRLSFERIAHTWKTVQVWRYLGSRTSTVPSIDDLPDPIFMEVADRAYDTISVEINAWWPPINEKQMDLSQFGIIDIVGDTQEFRFHSYSMEPDGLGRYIIIGDILEVPFLEIDGQSVFFEVTDVDRRKENETFEIIVNAKPMENSQETAEIDNLNQNEAKLEDLMGRIDGISDVEVEWDEADTTGIDVDDPTTDTYDPRPDHAEDFLDDPSKPIF